MSLKCIAKGSFFASVNYYCFDELGCSIMPMALCGYWKFMR